MTLARIVSITALTVVVPVAGCDWLGVGDGFDPWEDAGTQADGLQPGDSVTDPGVPDSDGGPATDAAAADPGMTDNGPGMDATDVALPDPMDFPKAP